MRIEIKPETVEKIEQATGEKMTTRCDKVVNKLLEKLDTYEQGPNKCWTEELHDTDKEMEDSG